LNEKAKSITGVHQWPYRAVARALEVIPRTLIQNCGASTIRTLTALRVCIVDWMFKENSRGWKYLLEMDSLGYKRRRTININALVVYTRALYTNVPNCLIMR